MAHSSSQIILFCSQVTDHYRIVRHCNGQGFIQTFSVGMNHPYIGVKFQNGSRKWPGVGGMGIE